MFYLQSFFALLIVVTFFNFPVSYCDDELTGGVSSFVIYHSLEPSSSNPEYKERGVVTYYSGQNEAVYSESESPASSIKKLKKLALSDDIYRIKLGSRQGKEIHVFSFTKACAIYESKLSDILTITLDQSGSPVGIAISGSPSYCFGEMVDDNSLVNFNTSVNIVSLTNAPSPDTLTYIQRLEQEKAEKARGEQGDNRSFFSKYWMYIAVFVLFLFISGGSGEQQGGGGR